MVRILKIYWTVCRTEHVWKSGLYSVLLGIVTIAFAEKITSVNIRTISSIVQMSIPVLTFQAALHSSSLLFFANTNLSIIEKFRNRTVIKERKKTTYSQFDQVCAYFSWSVLVQFMILIVNFIAYIIVSDSKSSDSNMIFIALAVLLASMVFYALIICMINIGLIFEIITWKK